MRALKELLFNHSSCSCGCVYPEITEVDVNCDECEFTRSIKSILS